MRTQSYGMAPRMSIESFFPADDATAAAMRDYPLT
jgi:hypothetical protein